MRGVRGEGPGPPLQPPSHILTKLRMPPGRPRTGVQGRQGEGRFGREQRRVGAEGRARKPSGHFGPREGLVGRQGSRLSCGSLPQALALALRPPAAAASDRGWETCSLPGGACYQQLLLLSPARIILPQPTVSPWAPSPPAPPSPSPPPTTSSAATRARQRGGAVTRPGSELRGGGLGGGSARNEPEGPGGFKPAQGGWSRELGRRD